MVWQGEMRSKSETRPVALKQLLFGIENIPEKILSEFLREIKLMSALRHENVVEFIGVSHSDSGELYLVTELMQNGSLSDLIERKQNNLPWSLRLNLLQDAASGMAYLHSRNLIHRDLKSQNLLVNDQWICKVFYFPLSFFYSLFSSPRPSPSPLSFYFLLPSLLLSLSSPPLYPFTSSFLPYYFPFLLLPSSLPVPVPSLLLGPSSFLISGETSRSSFSYFSSHYFLASFYLLPSLSSSPSTFLLASTPLPPSFLQTNELEK